MVGSPGNISSLIDIAVISLCYVSKTDVAPVNLWLCSVCTVWNLVGSVPAIRCNAVLGSTQVERPKTDPRQTHFCWFIYPILFNKWGYLMTVVFVEHTMMVFCTFFLRFHFFKCSSPVVPHRTVSRHDQVILLEDCRKLRFHRMVYHHALVIKIATQD